MDQLISELNSETILRNISLFQFTFAMFFSLSLNLILAKCYQYFNTSYTNPSSTLKSIVLIGLIITLIMIIIGSNIARAFALVGAMSIVRFRNPVKDSRDLVFVFAAIAIGMACGTHFYQFAAIFLFVFCLLLISFKYFKFGDLAYQSYVIKIRLKKDKRSELDEILKKFSTNHTIMSIDKMDVDDVEESIIFEFQLKNNFSYDNFLKEIEFKVSPDSLSLLVGEGNVSA